MSTIIYFRLLFLAALLFTSDLGLCIVLEDPIIVKKTKDFELTGDGKDKSWEATSWVTLPQWGGTPALETKIKALYSDKGIYFLFYCQDEVLTSSNRADFDKLWEEDVVEVFLWPDTTETVYFEYELSPFNSELPILVPNLHGKFLGWRPWQYEGERKTRHLTKIEGGSRAKGSKIKGWYAEFFIPYALLEPLGNVPPRDGTEWRANMYRVDYDHPPDSEWSWKKPGDSYHNFRKFGKLVFK
jgi:Carbohydrate family 9 binding domain-like